MGNLSPTHPRWWFAFSRLLASRVKDQRLPQVAGALTFTTVLALVPLVTVVLAVFTAFPMFEQFYDKLQDYMLQSFFPDTLSGTILTYINQFSAKAKGLTAIGTVFLVGTALTTMLTVDRVFNQIWHVQRQRPLLNNIMLYWAAISLAPVLIGFSLSMSTALFNLSIKGVGLAQLEFFPLLSIIPLFFTVLAFAFLYLIIPNRAVRVKDAMIGGLLAAVLFEISKRAFAAYITHFPSYTAVYGALAAFPIFLLWIYLSWLIVLLGACTVAALPVARTGNWNQQSRAGERWVRGLLVLRRLDQTRRSEKPGMTMEELRVSTGISPDQLDDILTLLIEHQVVGLLSGSKSKERFALLIDPQSVGAEVVAKLFWYDCDLTSQAMNLIPSGGAKLEAFEEQFIKQSRLSDWLT